MNEGGGGKVESKIVPVATRDISATGATQLPAIISADGEKASVRFMEFFTANIRNRNTREAYARAVGRFGGWCTAQGLSLKCVAPVVVAAYVEDLMTTHAAPTVKQHLAAIRMLMDWLVVGQVLPSNPAASVRGPKHVVRKGKTLVLSADQARHLLDSIPIAWKDERTGEVTPILVGLRDRALIGTMVYSFARVSAVVGMNVEDYWQNGKRWWLRLHEKGGKHHEVPAHHFAEEYLDAYLAAAGIACQAKAPLFRTAVGRTDVLTTSGMSRRDVWHMIRRRARNAGLPLRTCCHTFRATGITAYLANGGTIEKAQIIAAHESPRTTKLYDRTSDEITVGEIERIRI
jgi:site-specific recombinase XerD